MAPKNRYYKFRRDGKVITGFIKPEDLGVRIQGVTVDDANFTVTGRDGRRQEVKIPTNSPFTAVVGGLELRIARDAEPGKRFPIIEISCDFLCKPLEGEIFNWARDTVRVEVRDWARIFEMIGTCDACPTLEELRQNPEKGEKCMVMANEIIDVVEP